MISEELRRQLNAIVELDGRTQNKIGMAANIDSGLLSKALRGGKNLSMESFERLVEVLDCTITITPNNNEFTKNTSASLTLSQINMVNKICLALSCTSEDSLIMEDLQIATRLLERAAERALKERLVA